MFLCVLDYMNTRHPRVSQDQTQEFLKNYMSDISALAISPQKIIELEEYDYPHVNSKRMDKSIALII